MFGEWTVEPVDEFEVFTYRAGISVAAAGLLSAQRSAYRLVERKEHAAS